VKEAFGKNMMIENSRRWRERGESFVFMWEKVHE